MSLIEETQRRTAAPAGQKRPAEFIQPPQETLPDETAPVTLAPAKRKKLPIRKIIVLFVLFSLLGFGLYEGANFWMDSRQYEWTDDAFVDGHIIPISPQVAARVLEVTVNDNQPVKKGDLLVQLDPADYQAVLDQRKATVASMDGKLQETRTMLAVDQANVGQAKAELDVQLANARNMDQDFNRYNGLDPRARSQQQLDNATANQRSANAMVEQAQAKVTAAQAQVDDAQAAINTAQSDVAKAAADVHQAEIQLGYCTITASQDGIVTRKDVETGMYVLAGQPLFSIVPTDVWVTANYKETQLDQMRPGQDVEISIDAYPEKTFHGKLQSIQRGTGSKFTLLPAENATGNFVKVVQRVPVKIVLDADEMNDPQHPLALGMSAIPKVKVRPRESLWVALGLTPSTGATLAAGDSSSAGSK